MRMNNHITSVTPVIYKDGRKLFSEFKKIGYTTHTTGLFILAPSGAGKTHFVTNQRIRNWIDGDDLWPASGADYTDESWNNNMTEVMEVNARCDIVTLQAKKAGFWIIGSSNLFLRPDAIVLPDWAKHKAYITKREAGLAANGALSSDFSGVKEHRALIRKWLKYDVPIFSSVKEASLYCAQLKETNNQIINNL